MTSRKLDFAERWLRSGIEACHVPALFEFLDVDTTQAVTLIERAHLRGKRITHTHILVRGAALALARNPALHVMGCGKRHYQPDEVRCRRFSCRRFDSCASTGGSGCEYEVCGIHS